MQHITQNHQKCVFKIQKTNNINSKTFSFKRRNLCVCSSIFQNQLSVPLLPLTNKLIRERLPFVIRINKPTIYIYIYIYIWIIITATSYLLSCSYIYFFQFLSTIKKIWLLYLLFSIFLFFMAKDLWKERKAIERLTKFSLFHDKERKK